MDRLPYAAVFRLYDLACAARRRNQLSQSIALVAVAGACAALILLVIAAMASTLLERGHPYVAGAGVALSCAPLFGRVIVRRALVPLGWYRWAYWSCVVTYTRDSKAVGMAAAAWAHLRRPTPQGQTWLCHRRDRRIPLGDAEVVVTAFLAAGAGDADAARQLLRSVCHLVEAHCLVRELAGEWLTCDAAERGAWAEIAADVAASRWPPTALTHFLEGIALVRSNALGAPSSIELRLRWLLAPYRRATQKMLGPAPVDAQAPTVSTDDSDDAASAAPLHRAIATHLRLTGPATAVDYARAVAAWDNALADATTRLWICRRAVELEAPASAADRAIDEIARTVTDELARIADTSAFAAPAVRGIVGDPLARRLRHGRLDALETAFERWALRRPRTGDTLGVAPIDEWREWVALRAAYDAATAAGGVELRRLAFPHAFRAASRVATWLWNDRGEHVQAHAIFRWLLGEANAAGDSEAIELSSQNARLAVPTRTGRVTFAG